MNDDSVALELRIEAAKALLTYVEFGANPQDLSKASQGLRAMLDPTPTPTPTPTPKLGTRNPCPPP
jgi:hypothetical protein